MNSWRHSLKWNKFFDEFGIGAEVCQHSFRTKEEMEKFHRDQPCIWNTYILLADTVRWSKDGKICAPYVVPNPMVDYLWNVRNALDGLSGWNGGPTFASFDTDERGCRHIKIGDDYAHLWDVEDRRFELYTAEYMQRQVEMIVKEAYETLTSLMPKEST